jgi:hypothetical protein
MALVSWLSPDGSPSGRTLRFCNIESFGMPSVSNLPQALEHLSPPRQQSDTDMNTMQYQKQPAEQQKASIEVVEEV